MTGYHTDYENYRGAGTGGPVLKTAVIKYLEINGYRRIEYSCVYNSFESKPF